MKASIVLLAGAVFAFSGTAAEAQDSSTAVPPAGKPVANCQTANAPGPSVFWSLSTNNTNSNAMPQRAGSAVPVCRSGARWNAVAEQSEVIPDDSPVSTGGSTAPSHANGSGNVNGPSSPNGTNSTRNTDGPLDVDASPNTNPPGNATGTYGQGGSSNTNGSGNSNGQGNGRASNPTGAIVQLLQNMAQRYLQNQSAIQASGSAAAPLPQSYSQPVYGQPAYGQTPSTYRVPASVYTRSSEVYSRPGYAYPRAVSAPYHLSRPAGERRHHPR